jgi:Transposase DDE domain
MPPAFDRTVLGRLPLSEAVLLLARHATAPEALNDLFDRHRGAGYERELSFATLVALTGDALLEHDGSGRQSFQRGREQGALTVTDQAAYQKLGRLPLPVSEAFLAESTQHLLQVLPTAPPSTTPVPPSLRALEIMVLDGKVVKRVPKRLRPLRSSAGGVLGGKALAALSLRHRLVLAFATHADGHTNEAKLVPALLPQVRAHTPNILWVADAQFGNPQQIAAFTARPGDHVVVRYDGKSQFGADPSRPPQSGQDRRGRRYQESWGWLGGPRNRHRTYVRRLVLERPGKPALVVVTDLIDSARYPADDILEVYLQRWGIEHVFQEITEVFQLQHLIGSTPQGTLFQLALCLWWYNLIQVVRAYVAAGAGEAVEQVSAELLFVDVQRQLIALHELVPADEVGSLLPAVSGRAELRARLQRLLEPLWTERWRKAPPQQRSPRLPRRRQRKATSAYRLIHQARLAKHKFMPK